MLIFASTSIRPCIQMEQLFLRLFAAHRFACAWYPRCYRVKRACCCDDLIDDGINLHARSRRFARRHSIRGGDGRVKLRMELRTAIKVEA